MNEAERRACISTLSDDIAGYDNALATEHDAKRKFGLMQQRSQALAELSRLDDNKAGASVDYDELTRMIYELKSDMAIMKRQLDDHVRACATEGAGFPPNVLTFLAIGGVVTLLMLAFLVIRIGIPG